MERYSRREQRSRRFPEMYPYNPEKAKAMLKEAGFDDKNPLKYTIMTHGAEPALPNIATIIKTQLANIGVDVTIEVLDRPIFLRRLTTTKEYDQVVNFSSHIVDPFARSFVLDSRRGANVANHKDGQVDAILDSLALAPTAEEFSRLRARAPGISVQKHDLHECHQPAQSAGGSRLCPGVRLRTWL